MTSPGSLKRQGPTCRAKFIRSTEKASCESISDCAMRERHAPPSASAAAASSRLPLCRALHCHTSCAGTVPVGTRRTGPVFSMECIQYTNGRRATPCTTSVEGSRSPQTSLPRFISRSSKGRKAAGFLGGLSQNAEERFRPVAPQITQSSFSSFRSSVVC